MPPRARWLALRGGLGLAVAVLAVLIAATSSDSGESTRPEGVVLQLDRDTVRAGGTFRLRVLAPKGARHEDAIYGVESTLERRVYGPVWAPTHHLGVGSRIGRATFARYGDPTWAVPLIGFFGARWWTLRVPDDAKPGRYRIIKDVGRRSYTAELTIRT